MDIEILTKFGMTPTEAKVYLSILAIKDAPIKYIIKKTALHRGTVYNSLSSLIRKGFISFINKKGVTYYNVSGNKIFDTIIETEKKSFEDNRKILEETLAELNKYRKDDDNQEISILNGINSFKSLFFEMIEECKQEKLEYFFQGEFSEIEKIFGERFYKDLLKLNKEFKIHSKFILDKENNIKENFENNIISVRRLLDKKLNPNNLFIYGDKVLISFLKIDPVVTISIKSKYIANSFRENFNTLWSSPTPINDREQYAFRLIEFIKNAEKFDTLCKSNVTPFFFYPHNKEEFLKYRAELEKRTSTITGQYDWKIMEAYLNFWKRNGKMSYVIGEEAIKKFLSRILEDFGKKELKRRIADIKKNIKKYNIDIRVIEDFNPLTIYLSEDGFIVVIPASEEIYGAANFQKNANEAYKQIYEEYWCRGKSFNDSIDKFLSL